MGLSKTFKLSQLPKEKSLRFDVDFIECFSSQKDEKYSTYKELFDFVENEKVDLDNLDSFDYVEIGNIEKNGDINPVNLSFDNRNEENENYFKKIEKGDILKPKFGDILMSSIRPYLNKNILISNESVYFTKAMIQLRPKINSKLLYYSLRTVFYDLVNAVSRQGKGYPTLKEDDLKTIKFPKKVINTLIKDELLLLEKLEPIEKEIQTLKAQKKDPLKIMNEVFANEFKINLQKVFELDSIKSFSLKLRNIDSRNDLLRTSYKWHKLETIQSFMYEEIDCIEKLGKFIVQTKNGWSPESSEIEEGMPVLGQEHILKKGIIDLNPTKYTTLTKSNIQDFFVKQNDFFVSRGNTVELVALAGVVLEDIEQDIIYPDLYIKIDFNDELVDKQYMAFLFNSFIGRIYFKHVAKGKNQTMVKVSSKELLEFYLPLPDLTKQQQIVEIIKSQIDAQKLIDEQIEQKQKEISDLIYQCVKGS